jgi:hypothetical protein
VPDSEELPIEGVREPPDADQVRADVLPRHELRVLLAHHVEIEAVPVLHAPPREAHGVAVGPQQIGVKERRQKADDGHGGEQPRSGDLRLREKVLLEEAAHLRHRPHEGRVEQARLADCHVDDGGRQHVDHRDVVREPQPYREPGHHEEPRPPRHLEAHHPVERPRREEEVKRVHLRNTDLVPHERARAEERPREEAGHVRERGGPQSTPHRRREPGGSAPKSLLSCSCLFSSFGRHRGRGGGGRLEQAHEGARDVGSEDRRARAAKRVEE